MPSTSTRPTSPTSTRRCRTAPPAWPSPPTCAAATSAPRGWPRAATTSWRRRSSASSASTASSWSGTTPAPAASSRCASSRRARWSSSGWSPPSAASWRTATRCCGASRRPRGTSTSTSCACRRSAASPPRWRATSSRRSSRPPSCGSWSRSPKRCGADSPVHDRGLARVPRPVEADLEEVPAALEQPPGEAGVAVGAAVVGAPEVAQLALVVLEEHHHRVGRAERGQLVAPGGRRLDDQVGLLGGPEAERQRLERLQAALGRRRLAGIPLLRPVLVDRGEPAGRVDPVAVLRRLLDQAGREVVFHDGLRVPGGTGDLRRAELLQDVVERLVARPEVRVAGEVGVDGPLVPDDPGEGVLVLVRQAEGVADLVQRRGVPVVGRQVPAEVHRALVDGLAEDLAADVRPRAVRLHEPDADLRVAAVGDLLEVEAEREGLPLGEALAHDRPLVLRAHPGDEPARAVGQPDGLTVLVAVEEVVVQLR